MIPDYQPDNAGRGSRRNNDAAGSRRLISLIVPVLNETLAIGPFLERVHEVLSPLSDIDYELVFVDDGSTDATVPALLNAQDSYENLRIVELTRNFGKEAALSAGLDAARGHAVIPIDVDLQDPPELIGRMLECWRQGADVVLAHRTDRSRDSALKRITARLFYRAHNAISVPPIPDNVGDFRLMDRAVVEALKLLPENRRFMKGLFAWVGFRTVSIDYARPQRNDGESRFNTWKLWNMALEALTSFSTAPLRIWTYLGAMIAVLAFAYALFLVLLVLTRGVDVPGYASVFVAVAFFGGLQLLGIGIIGEYLGRTYLEAKRRHAYLVRCIHEPSVKDRR